MMGDRWKSTNQPRHRAARLKNKDGYNTKKQRSGEGIGSQRKHWGVQKMEAKKKKQKKKKKKNK